MTNTTVAIIGGGVAGLTLANALEQAGIAYLLWESHEQIAPPAGAGASLGLMPNRLRILDQLGVVDEVEKYAVAHDSWEHRDGDDPDGKRVYNTFSVMRGYRDELVCPICICRGFKIYCVCARRLGYSGFFLERQRFLDILYRNIKDKTRIFTKKKVVRVQSLDDRAIVTAADDSQISCDVVAGADGLKSAVRAEMEAMSMAGVSRGEHCMLFIQSDILQAAGSSSQQQQQ